MPSTSEFRPAPGSSTGSTTFVCAPMQAGLIYEALAGSSGAYVQQVTVACEERVNEARLRAAWLQLVARHGALRTSFDVAEQLAPRQRVHPHVDLGVVTVDWTALPVEVREERWRELLSAERAAGFEPAHPPLARVAICRFAEAHTRMLWTYHHAILDGRSRLTLLRGLFDLYDRPDTDCTPATASTFPAFAAWAAERGADPATEAFWRDALRGVEKPTPAPGTGPGAAAAAASNERVVLARRLSWVDSDRLREMAAQSGLTPATVLQGAYALLLAQESDSDDLLYATTRAGRRSAPFDTLDTVGLLMVTSPVRLRLEPEATVVAWMKTVSDFGRAVRDFEHAPLADVRRWSAISRPHPIAETMFSYENASMNTLLRAADPAWGRRDVQLIEQLAFPFTLEAFGDEEILVKVLADGERVPAVEAQRLLVRYEELLLACVEHPQGAVADVVALAPARRRELSGEGIDLPSGAEELVPARIRRQAREHPDRVALERAGSRTTYAELDRRADELASSLVAVGATGLVAVAMARTPDMVAALLAVHRIGAAYVPLDPRYPLDRLRLMLIDSGARTVLTDERSCDIFPPVEGVRVVVADKPSAKAVVGAPALHRTAPGELSHVIYTSGSTGMPKGVMVEHGAVAQLTAWAAVTFSDVERDGMLASTSLSFDLSVFELLTTLALGGRVVLVDDALALADPALEGDITFVNTVPSALSAVLAVRDLPASVTTVALAGEALPTALVQRLGRQPSVSAVWNLYGPTEDTTYSTVHHCRDGERPLIGRPLPGTQAFVVDRHLRPVPAGVPGELMLGGQGLARGYLGREELTAECFVTIEWADAGPTRMYRTGDRVRWTGSGELDYLGRLDEQVKIRGIRVEPGELAHTLRALDSVTDAAVITRGDGAERELVAYVVAAGDARPDEGELRRALAVRLPAALLPGALVVLDALPLTPNGKLDRRALPEPGEPTPTGGLPAAMDATQLALSAVWADVLDLKASPGPADDFFALGGDSLDGLQLLAAVEERFARHFTVRQLLGATTLAAQAAAIYIARNEPAHGQLIPLRPTGSRPPLFCVLTDQRGVMGLRNVVPAMLSDQPVFAMQAIDPAVPSWRTSSIEQIAAACLRAVRAERPRGPYRLSGHSLGGLVAYEMAAQLTRVGEHVELLALLDTVAPERYRRLGRVLARDRLLRDESVVRRVRGQANLVRGAVLEYVALARGEVILRNWPLGFDDPWDQAGAGDIMRHYRPPALDAPVTVFHTSLSTIQAGGLDLGWRRHVAGPFTTREVPGGHLTIFSEPFVRQLSTVLAHTLQALDPPGRGSSSDSNSTRLNNRGEPKGRVATGDDARRAAHTSSHSTPESCG